MRLRHLVHGLAVLICAGCTTSITTRIEVAADATAAVIAGVEFTGDVARTLQEDATLRAQLESQLRARGLDLQVHDGGRSYTAALTAEQVVALGSLTGVGTVRTQRVDDATVRVTVELVDPSQLRTAVIESVRAAPDAEALAATVAANTYLRVEIAFPGAVRASDAGVVDGSTVTYESTLAAWTPRSITVDGSVDTGVSRWWFVGGAALLAGVWFARRARG